MERGRRGDVGVWDVATSQNWTNLNTTASDAGNRQFKQLDTVLLDDSIITSGGTNVLTITTNNPVQPTSITVNSTTNYTITGPGSIAGTLKLVQDATAAPADQQPPTPSAVRSPSRAARCWSTTPTRWAR